MNEKIKAKFVTEVWIADTDSNLQVSIAILKMETGGMIGIDSSFLEQDIGPVYSPLDEGVELEIEE